MISTTRGTGITQAFMHDGSEWLECFSFNPAIKTIANGEVMFIFNPDATAHYSLVTGPANPGFTQLNLQPGFHMRGRWKIGSGIFESTIGRSPKDYDSIHVYRLAYNTFLSTAHQTRPVRLRTFQPRTATSRRPIESGAGDRLKMRAPAATQPQIFPLATNPS